MGTPGFNTIPDESPLEEGFSPSPYPETGRKKDLIPYQHGFVRHEHGIDRLELELPTWVERADFVERQRVRGKKAGCWRDESRWYLVDEESGIRLRLWNRYSPASNKIVCNPTHFQNFLVLDSQLTELLGGIDFRKAKIIRADLAQNIPLPLRLVCRGLDVKRKKKVQLFSCGLPTGQTFGKGESRIVIYDFGLRHKKRPFTTTRLEAQLSGRKLPITYFSELNQIPILIHEGKFRPFRDVELYEIKLVETNTVTDPEQLVRLARLETALDLVGYANCRRYLNRNRNFHRDYAPLFSKKAFFDVSLDQNLGRHLTTYFEKGFNYENSIH